MSTLKSLSACWLIGPGSHSRSAAMKGRKAETHTIIPVIKAFQDQGWCHRYGRRRRCRRCWQETTELDKAGLRFHRRSVEQANESTARSGDALSGGTAEWVLTASHRHHHPETGKRLDPQKVKKKREPVWSAEAFPDAWRVVWQYRRKRAMRDEQTLNLQRNKALEIIEGQKPAERRPGSSKSQRRDREGLRRVLQAGDEAIRL